MVDVKVYICNLTSLIDDVAQIVIEYCKPAILHWIDQKKLVHIYLAVNPNPYALMVLKRLAPDDNYDMIRRSAFELAKWKNRGLAGEVIKWHHAYTQRNGCLEFNWKNMSKNPNFLINLKTEPENIVWSEFSRNPAIIY
jgi:hypothetical protein